MKPVRYSCRRSTVTWLLVLTFTAGFAIPRGHSEEIGLHVLELPLQGVRIECDDDGGWLRIYSIGSQPVEFPDRRGISTAQKIAEERAKAQIIKFFQQDVSAERIAMELENVRSETTRRRGTGDDGVSSDAQRTLATSLVEVMRSYSEGTLRGLVTLEAGYDENAEEAWVKLGVSRESIDIARRAQAGMNSDPSNPDSAGSVAAATHGADDEVVVRQPSERRIGDDLPGKWSNFSEARGFVRALNLKSRSEWAEYCQSGDKPGDIPASPDVTYKDRGWKSWDDWLGVSGERND